MSSHTRKRKPSVQKSSKRKSSTRKSPVKSRKCKYGRDPVSGKCRKKYGGNKGDERRSAKKDYSKKKKSPRRSPAKKSRRRRGRGPTKRHICKYGRLQSGLCRKRAVAKKDRSRRATAPVHSHRRRSSPKRSSRRRHSMSLTSKTRKAVPWAGWGKLAPQGAERTKMYQDCGQKCFLGTETPGDAKHPDFPICAKNTCKVSSKGLYAAYIRARQWGGPPSRYEGKTRPRMSREYYNKIARKAKAMLEQRQFAVH
jgi:hypothetical protein